MRGTKDNFCPFKIRGEPQAMKMKNQLFTVVILLSLLLLMSACQDKNVEIPDEVNPDYESKIAIYIPNEKPVNRLTKEHVTQYAWEVYDTLSAIEPKGTGNEGIYQDIERNYFIELKENQKNGYFPWFEDTLFNVMNFKHLKALSEEIVCIKTVNNRNYYLVELSVLGSYHYELTSNAVIEEKSGLTTMALYLVLATNEAGDLGYYSLLSFTKEPREIDTEIKMFNGIVDAQNEQLYLKTVKQVPEGLKELTYSEQFSQNNSKVVTLYAEQKDGSIRQTNGCYVHQYLILTPLEWLENCERAWIYTSDKRLIPIVGIVESSKKLDLANSRRTYPMRFLLLTLEI